MSSKTNLMNTKTTSQLLQETMTDNPHLSTNDGERAPLELENTARPLLHMAIGFRNDSRNLQPWGAPCLYLLCVHWLLLRLRLRILGGLAWLM